LKINIGHNDRYGKSIWAITIDVRPAAVNASGLINCERRKTKTALSELCIICERKENMSDEEK
jgi:hypothetical protein